MIYGQAAAALCQPAPRCSLCWRANECGCTGAADGLKGESPLAETLMLQRDLALAMQDGAPMWRGWFPWPKAAPC